MKTRNNNTKMKEFCRNIFNSIGIVILLIATLAISIFFGMSLAEPYLAYGVLEEVIETMPEEETTHITLHEEIEISEEPELAVEIPVEEVPETSVAETEEPTVEVVEISSFNQKEFEDRCRLTYAESGHEPLEGQIAVAATIINRERSVKHPNTFYEVMNARGQFSSVKNGEIYIMTKKPHVLHYETVSEKTIDATKRALEGEDPTEALLWAEAERLGLDPEKYAAGGALFFYNPNAVSEKQRNIRANIRCKVRIGNHVFYKVWDE